MSLMTVIFVSVISFFLVSLSIFVIMRLRPRCNCEICQDFVSSRWSLEFSNLCDWYSHLLRKSKTGTIHVHVLGNIITANSENVEYILKTKFLNYPKGKPFSAILGDLLGRGIFNVDGHLWKFQRKMASLELSNLSVKSYAFEIVASEIRYRLIPLLMSYVNGREETHVVDLQDVFRRFSFDSICKFSFGLDPGCLKLSLPVSDFAVAFDLASKLSAERALTISPLIWKIKRFFNFGNEKKLKEAIQLVNLLADELIKHKRLTLDHISSSSHQDLLSRFMSTIEDDKFLREIVISFVLAGRDTVASALTTLFWLLSKNPNAVEAIREESDRVMGSEKDQNLASFEQLREMHYLQAVVHESMRLFPPVQFDSKFCQEDDVLPDGTFVAKGTRVTYHPYAMGRMETIWGPNSLEFRPERWLQDGIFKQVNPFKYPVFQAGLRVCLGKEMALVEIKTVALSLIRKFDIQMASPNGRLYFGPGLTATVKNGMPVLVRERNCTKHIHNQLHQCKKLITS